MPISKPNMDVILAGGAKLVEAGRASGELIVAYGKPALQSAADLTTQAAKWGSENPVLAGCTAVGIAGAGIVVAPSVLTVPALSSVGFTTAGIKAGSLAASAHSAIGNIATGSFMAISQSAGAGGSGLAIINGAAQAGGAAMSVGSAGLAWVKSKL